jgi:hypothetical protein
MADVDLQAALVGLAVAMLLVAAGQRWVAETIEDATGGLLGG